ncbi:hypothetical protein SAMN05877809_10113 [Rhodobacter sp. JA431]|nr:hypothetical protein SAMN05877809_10113 [Rhodobacter sp. JA431]
MRIPCGGPLNLLTNQYHGWWTSVFLAITSECANIPAFSYVGHQVFIVLFLLKSRDHRAGQYTSTRPIERNQALSTG